ncbi:hypothetical protein D7Y09_09310 [bacterium 1XD42-1]|nr:hypothetical protein D7X25_07430 [bacterium 1XD42-8]RKJ64209.1 hypothetical protein D7Y09_09310 [bacterium 1XD42-1]
MKRKLSKSFALILAVCLCITIAVPVSARKIWWVHFVCEDSGVTGPPPESPDYYFYDDEVSSPGKTEFGFPSVKLEKEGYSFVGWTLTPDEEITEQNLPLKGIYNIPQETDSGDIYFYGRFQPDCEIQFDIMDATDWRKPVPWDDRDVTIEATVRRPAWDGKPEYDEELTYTKSTDPQDPSAYWIAPFKRNYPEETEITYAIKADGFKTFEGSLVYPAYVTKYYSIVVSMYPDDGSSGGQIWPFSPPFIERIEGGELDGEPSLELLDLGDHPTYKIQFKIKPQEGKKVKLITISNLETIIDEEDLTVTEVEPWTYSFTGLHDSRYVLVFELESDQEDPNQPTISSEIKTPDGKVLEDAKIEEISIVKNEDGTYKVSFKIALPEGYSSKSVSVNATDLDVDADGNYFFTGKAGTSYTVKVIADEIYPVKVDDELQSEGITDASIPKSDFEEIQNTVGEDAELQLTPSEKDASEDIADFNSQLNPSDDEASGGNTSPAVPNIPGYELFAKVIKEILTNTAVSIDISIYKDARPQSYDKPVNIEMDIPRRLNGAKNILAIHYHNDQPRLVPVQKINNKLKFTLKGLSDVVLVAYEQGENKPVNSSDNRYVAYNPSSNRGSGSGSSGGSTGGKSVFSPLTSTINGILKSQLSKGIVGASAATNSVTASVSAPATQAAAARALSQAISQARSNGSNNAQISMRNISVVSANILQALVSDAQKSGLNAYLSVDTMKNGIVDVRVQIPVSAAARLGRDINMASMDNTAVKAHFNRYYSNRLDVVALAQKGSFGVPASVAARLALPNAKAADLHFYSFNAATNTYQEITQTDAFFDVNGYLHFNTELGDYIIISVDTLKRK